MSNVRVANIRHSDKNLEGILLVGLSNAAFNIPLDLRLALFPVPDRA